MGTLREAQHTFLITSRSVLLRMRNVSDNSCREHKNRFYVKYLLFFFGKSVVYEGNVEKYCVAERDTG